MAAAKFKLGDKVKVNGQEAEVIVVSRDVVGPVYGVKFQSWERVVIGKDGQGDDVCRFKKPGTDEMRDHEYDSQGAIHEDDLEAAT